MIRVQEPDWLFKDRRAAGQFLASRLLNYKRNEEVIVLALPRGGVPVGYEIAGHLSAPLDIFIVKKLGAPLHEELALGAIASGGVRVLNDEIIRRLQISPEAVKAISEEQRIELERREREYRRGRPPLNPSGKVCILVDDGLATGATMKAAVKALRKRAPAKIITAVPVGAPDICQQFESLVDEVVCGKAPEEFGAVGAWYQDFTQTTDAEVKEFLDSAAHELKVERFFSSHRQIPTLRV